MLAHDRNRQIITLIAAVGFLVSLLRVLPTPHWSTHRSLPPRAALAQEMQIYESALMDGSPVSYTAFRSVQRICKDDQGDAVIVQACGAFDDALSHDSNREAIDAAVRTLREP